MFLKSMKFKITKIRKSHVNRKRILRIINELFEFANNYSAKHRDLVLKNIGKHIWKLKLSYKLNLPIEIKRFLCRKCNTILVPGYNLCIRNYNHYMVYQCNSCGFTRRFKTRFKTK